MRLVTIIVILLCALMSGCLNTVKTAPWSDSEIERMEAEEIETVPIFRI